MRFYLFRISPLSFILSISFSDPALGDYEPLLSDAFDVFSDNSGGGIYLSGQLDGSSGPLSWIIDEQPLVATTTDNSDFDFDKYPFVSEQPSESPPSNPPFRPCGSGYTFCSSSFPTDTYVTPDERTVTLRNAKQCNVNLSLLCLFKSPVSLLSLSYMDQNHTNLQLLLLRSLKT